jgi:hypothetical protein
MKEGNMLGQLKLFALAALFTLSLADAARADALPLFDAHLHYSGNAWAQYPPEKVMQLLDEAGIAKALLSSTPIEGTLRLYKHAPERFVPELRVYRKATSLETWYEERRTWFKDPGTVTFLEEELKRGIYKGIGEFHVNGDEVDTPVMRRIADLAVANNIHLHAHSDAAAIAKLFEFNPKVRIIWAHAGMSTPVETVGEFVRRYPNLWVELSYRGDVSAGEGKVREVSAPWRALFLAHPERFLWGSDPWTPERWPEVPALAREARAWLKDLPAEVARKIAYENAKALFGL